MNKTTKRAAVAVASAALVAAGVGGAAATRSGGSAPVAAAKTLTFASITTGGHSTGAKSFAGSDVDKSKGKVIGYDSVSGSFNRRTQTATLDVAIALKGGLLYASGTSDSSGDFSGKVTGGTGAYKGAKGTATGIQMTPKKTIVTLKYHT